MDIPGRVSNIVQRFVIAVVVAGGLLIYGDRGKHVLPTSTISDMNVSAADILRKSPDVARVEVLVSPLRTTRRIIHIADSHYLSRPRYRMLSRPPSEEGYSAYLNAVAQLQHSQLRLLRWLVDYHGIREVFQEAISDFELPRFMERVNRERDLENSRERAMAISSRLRLEINDAEAHGKVATNLRKRREELDKVVDSRLNMGAVAALLSGRPCVKLHPAEDKDAYENAFAAAYARGKFRGPENDLREAAIVRHLLSHGKCAVIVLGAAHDLSKQVKLLGGGTCEYVRITTKEFPQQRQVQPTRR